VAVTAPFLVSTAVGALMPGFGVSENGRDGAIRAANNFVPASPHVDGLPLLMKMNQKRYLTALCLFPV